MVLGIRNKIGTESLREISRRYSYLLIDTCSLLIPIIHRHFGRNESLEAKTERYQTKSDSSDFFLDFLRNNGDLFVTQKILQEYAPSVMGDYKKKIRFTNPNCKDGKELLSLRRAFRDSGKGRRRLVNSFSESGHVLSLEDKELYSEIFEEYSLNDVEELSDADKDFFVTGAVLSKERPTALISNDVAISYPWKIFLRAEKMHPLQFGFFIRSGFNEFAKMNWKIAED